LLIDSLLTPIVESTYSYVQYIPVSGGQTFVTSSLGQPLF